MSNCQLCRSGRISDFLDFGSQPICNRFLSSAAAHEDSYPLKLGQCDTCGLIQIGKPIPAEELEPPYDWITYTEPEAHLDRLAETISCLPGISKDSAIWG